ncbi:MAG: ArsC/Spx/MgsR family protein [Crocinitomicaceae bacterium]
MKRIFHLSTCSTCQRILKEWNVPAGIALQDIKTDPITKDQIDKMIELSGSAESLFSRRAMKYKSMGLKDKNLSESDYRKLILDEYTFLKRPVLVLDDQVFVGNSKKAVVAAKEALNS